MIKDININLWIVIKNIAPYTISVATFFVGRFFQKNDRKRKKDNELLQEFIKALPQNEGFILYLQEFEAPMSYFVERHKAGDMYIGDFVRYWLTPERSFFNKKIDKKKNVFMDKLKKYDTLVIGCAYQMKHSDEMLSFRKSAKYDEDYQEPPEEDRKIISDINKLVMEIVREHHFFISYAREHLI